MDMEVEDIRHGREGQENTKHANIKKGKMSMTTNNIQEFRNTTKRIHRIKENIEIHVKGIGKMVNEILIEDTPHLGK